MLPLPETDVLIAQLKARGISLPSGPVHVDGYGDSEELSSELLALIRSGRTGDIEIVVDHLNVPVMVTRVVSSERIAFNQVTAEYAALEGEGDGSLAYWRNAHWNFFGRECQRIGREPTETMPVICTVFQVVLELVGTGQ